jgi:hypothetical protein
VFEKEGRVDLRASVRLRGAGKFVKRDVNLYGFTLFATGRM